MHRQELIKKWLADLYPGQDIGLEFAAADADFRRYFRATWPDGAVAS